MSPSKNSRFKRASRWFLASLLVICFFGPLLPLVPYGALDQVTAAQGTNASVTADTFAWKPFWVSLVVAGAAAGLAVVSGAGLAAILVLGQPCGRHGWTTLSMIPFITPPTVWALAQASCYGPGGLLERWAGDDLRPWLTYLNPGHGVSTSLILAQIHAPLAMLILGRGMARLPHVGWEAAYFYLGPASRLRWLWGAMRSDLVTAFLIVAALCLGNFAVPHVLQCRTYSVEIYFRLANYLDQVGAIRAARPLLSVAVFAAAVALFLDQRRPPPVADARTFRGGSSRLRTWLFLPLLGYLLPTIGLPFAALVSSCQSGSVFLTTVREAAPETENTLLIAVAAAAVASLAAVGFVAVFTRHQRVPMYALTAVAFAVPGLLIGVTYARSVSFLGWGTLGNLAVVWGLAFRGWPFTVRLVERAWHSFAPPWREVADLAGIGTLSRYRWLVVPWLLDDVAAGALVTYSLACGEVEISQLLCAPGGGTLALRLFTFLHFGPASVVGSLAVLQLILVLVPFGIYFLLTNRHLRPM